MKKLILLSTVLLASTASFAAGFALYQSSSASTALGGALVGKAYDGSANTINPATLTDFTNIMVTVGFVTEHPRARVKINDGTYMHKSKPMDPGFFALPHFQLVVPLPWDLVFGLGYTAEYGLGSEYTHDSLMTWSSQKTTIQGHVINPNLAYKVTDKWSIAAGLRLLYFDFDQYSYPMGYASGYHPLLGGYGEGRLKSHLRGNNGFADFGGRFGTSYKLLDNLSVGATYQTKITTHVKGHAYTRESSDPLGRLGSAIKSGNAHANLSIPQAASVGFNWDITPEWHLGGVASWTDWSSLDTIVFHLPTGDNPVKLNWKDTWRFGVAPSWDFAKDWTAMTSYVYDSNPCPSDQQSTMLPRGDRHILGWGLAWHVTENLELGLNYCLVLMNGKSMHLRNAADGRTYHMETHHGLSHAGGGSITYRF